MTITSNTGAEVAKAETIAVTVDGVGIEVPKGTLAIRAAELLGIEIPRFCDHPLLDPVAACRACLIEVEGMPKPQPACAQVLSDGMQIRTQQSSPVAREAQEGVMEFLLLNHPLDCPVCDKGGECPLQNQAMQVGRPTSRFEEDKRTFPKPISVSAQILLDRERCVSCARCTRFAEQIAGDPMLELLERGAKQQVGTATDEPFDSYFSGNTVQICPVGALTSAAYRFRSRPFDLVSVPTTCEHCASGCSLRTDSRRGTITRRLAWEDPAVNEDWNCDKGRFAFTYMAQGRITTPMVREDGALRPASWPEAIAIAARGLAQAGSGAGVLAGGRLTMEDAYGYARFARAVLGTDDIDFRARQSSDEEAQFLAARIAGTPATVTYEALERAPIVLLVSLEPEDESPIIFLRLRKASRRRPATVVAISPVRTRGMDKMAATWLPAAPGAEAGVLDEIMSGGSLAETSMAELRDRLQAPGAVILVGERAADVPGLLSAVARLADATGAGLAWVPRRAGERGALDAGALAGLLPGGRPLTDADARDAVARAWGIDAGSLPTAAGRHGTPLLQAASRGEVAALLVGGIEFADFPDPSLARAAVTATAFVVSLEQRHTEVTELADVVLPVAVVAEKAGTFLTWEGRPRPFGQVLREDLAMSDAGVLSMIAAELGQPSPGDVPALRRELGSLGPWSGARATTPGVPAQAITARAGITLASWRLLLDSGAMQEGEPHLAATARPTVARLSEATASHAGLAPAALVTVSGPRGSVTLPWEPAEMVDDVVWLPLRSPGCGVFADLGQVVGGEVAITPGGAA
ncbi:MAG: NADH-quinone oxidoreductase subunit G [Actinomycetales bacterium]|nr:NADH-quinone oxidoreductase subunit G [Actinomycetales bacterium]